MKQYDLQRFVDAQGTTYKKALAEIRKGKKQSHWMWYIFPQIKGLGYSSMAQYYAIEDLDEAYAYLHHTLLGNRLKRITMALLALSTNDPVKVMGGIDAYKLWSCMTLFSLVSKKDNVFKAVLDKFYHGKMDEDTLRLLGHTNNGVARSNNGVERDGK